MCPREDIGLISSFHLADLKVISARFVCSQEDAFVGRTSAGAKQRLYRYFAYYVSFHKGSLICNCHQNRDLEAFGIILDKVKHAKHFISVVQELSRTRLWGSGTILVRFLIPKQR